MKHFLVKHFLVKHCLVKHRLVPVQRCCLIAAGHPMTAVEATGAAARRAARAPRAGRPAIPGWILGSILSVLPIPGMTRPMSTPSILPLIEAGADEHLVEETGAPAYRRRIEALEARSGAFAPGLAQELLGLGLALQRRGDHEGAIDVFKRGIHLARIEEGLYGPSQIAILQGEIASRIAMGAYERADERQRYLYRIQARTLSDVTRGQALMQHALWQRQAYEAGVGEQPFTRLHRMWNLYRLALTEFVKAEGDTSPALLPALYGMLRSQYLLSGFVGETASGRFRTRQRHGDEESQQLALRGQAYKQGNSVIRTIYNIRTRQPDASRDDTLESLLMLADWQLWHGKRNDAMHTYAQLSGELAGSDDAEALPRDLLAAPQALPAVPGVRALPEPLAEQPGRLLLGFGVTERGRVVDLERLDRHTQNDAQANAIMRRLRKTPFRPRFSDGMPVSTRGLRWAYDTTDW